MSAHDNKKRNLEAVKKKLIERKEELEQQLKDLAQPQDNTGQVSDAGDEAQSSILELLRLSIQDAEIDEYHRILKALTMIEEGTYGICEDCEEPISERRLNSYPNATRCLRCQELREEGHEPF